MFLQCDVRQFFPSVDHAVLRTILSRKVMDPEVLWLIDLMLNSGVGVLSEQYDHMVYFEGMTRTPRTGHAGCPSGTSRASSGRIAI